MRKAIVMAGGRGSRLWPLTLTRPKPLVPVVNRPVMAHVLEWLANQGFTEVLLTLHYRADEIRRVFGDGRSLGLRITYSIEDEPLGTAGSVKLAEDWIGDEPFLVASGDALTDVDLGALQRWHRETGAWITLGLKPVTDPSQYGVVKVDARGRVIRFQEKPEPGRAISRLANTGIYCVDPLALEWIPFGQAYDWSHDLFPQLMAEGLPLFGQVLDGYWCDIGNVNEYRHGQRHALEGAVRVTLPAVPLRSDVWIGPGVSIDPDAVIEGPVLLGSGSRIEQHALVLPGSVVGERTTVGRGACISNAILGSDCRIEPKSMVDNCVIGDAVWIGYGCSVSAGAVVGSGCFLVPGMCLDGEQRLAPDQVVSANLHADVRTAPPCASASFASFDEFAQV